MEILQNMGKEHHLQRLQQQETNNLTTATTTSKHSSPHKHHHRHHKPNDDNSWLFNWDNGYALYQSNVNQDYGIYQRTHKIP